jgi:hypothetical protein
MTIELLELDRVVKVFFARPELWGWQVSFSAASPSGDTAGKKIELWKLDRVVKVFFARLELWG